MKGKACRMPMGRRGKATYMGLLAIGPNCAWLLVMEFFAWRGFRNRRQLGACAGLTGTPLAVKETRALAKPAMPGTMMVEIAWLWLSYQPSSKLSKVV